METMKHIMVNTGRAYPSLRGDVADDAIGAIAGVIAGSIAAEAPARIPKTGFILSVKTLPFRPGAVMRVLTDGHICLVKFGVGEGDSESAAWAWNEVTCGGSATMDECQRWKNKMPNGKWCVVRIEPEVIRVPLGAMTVLGDIERCCAWAWFDGAVAKALSLSYVPQNPGVKP